MKNIYLYTGCIPSGCYNLEKKSITATPVIRAGVAVIKESLFVGFDGAFHTYEGVCLETPFGLRKPTEEEMNAWLVAGRISLTGEEAFEIMEASSPYFKCEKVIDDAVIDYFGNL